MKQKKTPLSIDIEKAVAAYDYYLKLFLVPESSLRNQSVTDAFFMLIEEIAN